MHSRRVIDRPRQIVQRDGCRVAHDLVLSLRPQAGANAGALCCDRPADGRVCPRAGRAAVVSGFVTRVGETGLQENAPVVAEPVRMYLGAAASQASRLPLAGFPGWLAKKAF